jgi:hypothetical protein
MHRLLNFMVLTVLCVFAQGGLDYFFFYAIWEDTHVSLIFTHHILPCCIYTTVSALLVYPLIHNINRLLRPHTIRTIEEQTPPPEDTL